MHWTLDILLKLSRGPGCENSNVSCSRHWTMKCLGHQTVLLWLSCSPTSTAPGFPANKSRECPNEPMWIYSRIMSGEFTMSVWAFWWCDRCKDWRAFGDKGWVLMCFNQKHVIFIAELIHNSLPPVCSTQTPPLSWILFVVLFSCSC